MAVSEYKWNYNWLQNYGQLDFPLTTDNLFILKLKIETAESATLMERSHEFENHEWQIKLDAFGAELSSKGFKLNSEGKYCPERREGILIRIRSELNKFVSFLTKTTLRLKVELKNSGQVSHTGIILIKLIHIRELLTTGSSEKWLRITRDVKMNNPAKTELILLKLTLLINLLQDSQSFTENETSPVAFGNLSDDRLSVGSSAKENTNGIHHDSSDWGVTARKPLKRSSPSRGKSRKQKNPRISVGRLALLTADIEDKIQIIQSLKEEVATKNAELSELQSKVVSLETRSKIQAAKTTAMTTIGVQTENEVVSTDSRVLPKKSPLQCMTNKVDDAKVEEKLKILDKMIEEYTARSSSLTVKADVLKIRESKTIPRFATVGRNYKETIAKKLEIKKVIESNNIMPFIELELCQSLEMEIHDLEAQCSTAQDGPFKKKLENEISTKNQLLCKVKNHSK